MDEPGGGRSMRAWVIGFCRNLAIAKRLEEAFAGIGAPEAAAHLYGFMWALGHGARRLLAVDCVCRPQVSDDERRLLDILALYQAGRSLEAVLLLRSPAIARRASAPRISRPSSTGYQKTPSGPSEHPYHRSDPADWLKRTAGLVRAPA